MLGGRDDVDGLSDREIRRALGSLAHVGVRSVSRSDRVVGKIKNGRKPGNKVPLDWDAGAKGGLNRTVRLEVELPAYIVAGMLSEGDLNAGLREAAKEWLVKRGKTWWQPRFLTAMRAREIEANERFTSEIG